MINENHPLSMAESLDFIKSIDAENTEIIGFIKKFNSLKPGQAKEMREKIEELKLLKVKPEHIAKMIDLLPENSVDLNKIFDDISLDEDENKKILEIIKQYK
jgi:DNA-directed RNA polymerase subunit F